MLISVKRHDAVRFAPAPSAQSPNWSVCFHRQRIFWPTQWSDRLRAAIPARPLLLTLPERGPLLVRTAIRKAVWGKAADRGRAVFPREFHRTADDIGQQTCQGARTPSGPQPWLP